MERVWGALGAIALVLVVGGLFVATELDLGGGETIASRAPVVGPAIQGLADMAGPSSGPMIVVADNHETLTCGEFFELAAGERNEAMAELDRELQRAGADEGADAGAIIAAISCQLPPPNRKVQSAVRDLFERGAGGADPTVAICDAYKRDFTKMQDASFDAAAAQTALQQIVSSDNVEGTYPALVLAEREYRTAAAATTRLRGETDAGRRLQRFMGENFLELANIHRRWLGGASDQAAWSAGPEASGVSAWFEETDALYQKLKAGAAIADLQALPPGSNCDPQEP